MAWYNPLGWFRGSGERVVRGKQSGETGTASQHLPKPTFDDAMGVSAFFAAVRLMSETVGSMPLKCYRLNEDGSRAEDKNYRLWRTMNYMPNRYQTKNELIEQIMLSLMTRGNSYCRVLRNAMGVTSIMPLQASQMDVELDAGGFVVYTYTNANSEREVIPRNQIWHIKLFGNGIVGLSPISYAAQSLGIAIASDTRVGKLAKNGGKGSGILNTDTVLTDEQRAAVRRNMRDIAEGDTDGLKILEANMKFQQTSLSPQDMELLKTRRFQIEDIARFMGVPSILINDTASTTAWGSGIDQIVTGFFKLSLRPHLERIEASIKRHLMNPDDWDTIDIEFSFDSLLRSDLSTRLAAYSTAINSAQMTPNEARNAEGREDKEGGDDILINTALVKVGTVKNEND